jgi:uncharacterized protein involved in exopolysaccharide biosynthesis
MDHLGESPENQFKEIDLLDFIRVVKKRKKLIFSLSLIGLVLGVIWYFWAPSSYQGTIIFKVGGLENTKEIIEGFKKDIYGNYPKLEVINPSGTGLIEVNITTEERGRTNTFLERIETDILSIHNQKANEKIEAINKEISFFEGKIGEFEENLSYFSAREEQATTLKLEIYRMEKLINDLEKEKNNILMTEVIKGPEVTEKRPGYLSVFFALLLGFFVGLILAPFTEWLRKIRERI